MAKPMSILDFIQSLQTGYSGVQPIQQLILEIIIFTPQTLKSP